MGPADDADDDLREAEVSINPISDRLPALGITVEEFEQALPRALDEFHQKIERLTDLDAIPSLDEVELQVRGVRFLLGDVAEIVISGDVD
jgi:hypothetical protein